MFTLAISCLTTSNLPWFMDLTFQVPMQYCSLQHRTLLLSPVTSTTGCWFFFGSLSSFFLKLFLHWSPGAYWAPTDLGSSSFSVQSFYLFIPFMVFSRQEYWSGLPFPSPVDHILSEDQELTMAQIMNSLLQNSDLNWKKVGKITGPFRYDLNQIPYDYTVEVINRLKGLELIACLKNFGG